MRLIMVKLHKLLIDSRPLVLNARPFKQSTGPYIFNFTILIRLTVVSTLSWFQLQRLRYRYTDLVPLITSNFFSAGNGRFGLLIVIKVP